MNNRHPVRIYSYTDAEFPKRLLREELAPPCTCIHMRGEFPARPLAVSIVGTRKASRFGMDAARACATELSQRGVCIVSGLAMGIDAAAHAGALEGSGGTVAVLAHGLDRIYPAGHERLARDILACHGCLLSEYPLRTPPLPYRFLERNRIIAALSDAVVVIEAPAGSGSLATAEHARRLGTRLFVLPGSTSSPLYAGSHALLRAGARLFSSVSELLGDLSLPPLSPKTAAPTNPHAAAILALLRKDGSCASVDKLVEQTTLKPQDVQAALSELVLQGAVLEESAGAYRARN